MHHIHHFLIEKNINYLLASILSCVYSVRKVRFKAAKFSKSILEVAGFHIYWECLTEALIRQSIRLSKRWFQEARHVEDMQFLVEDM